MNLLPSLQKHLPNAAFLIEGVLPTRYDPIHWEEKNGEILCVYGLSASLYEQARSWLDDDAARRLIFVEDRPEALAQILKEEDAILLLNDLRVKLYFIETPLQIEPVARQIAWSAVLLRLETLALSPSPSAELFFTALSTCHKAAGLLLSDAADWGCQAARNAKVHAAAPFRSLLSTKGCFQGAAAILVGAGPSLEKQRQYLASFNDRALIFSSESALPLLPCEPHFAAAIDPHPSLLGKKGKIPFCTQARCHPSRLSSDLWIAPDTHFPFLNWLFEEEAPFDGGWTVGTFMIAVAHLWGCNPIVWVGMDCAYAGEQKYAGQGSLCTEGLVRTKDRNGEWVWTQNDWLFAKSWIEDFARENPSTRFIDANEQGLSFDAPILSQPLSSVSLKTPFDLKEKMEGLQSLPIRTSCARWELWKRSLERTLALCEQRLGGREAPLEEEIAYTHLLLPLWSVWRPVFERQLDLDPYKIALSEKLRLNETLFFQQVIQEHLNVLQ